MHTPYPKKAPIQSFVNNFDMILLDDKVECRIQTEKATIKMVMCV